MTATWFERFKQEMLVERDGEIQQEIDAMAQVHRALSGLTPKARERVLGHLLEAYHVERPVAP